MNSAITSNLAQQDGCEQRLPQTRHRQPVRGLDRDTGAQYFQKTMLDLTLQGGLGWLDLCLGGAWASQPKAKGMPPTRHRGRGASQLSVFECVCMCVCLEAICIIIAAHAMTKALSSALSALCKHTLQRILFSTCF